MENSTNKKYIEMVKPRLSEIEQWAKDGYSDKAIAKALGVTQPSFSLYKKTYSELREILNNARRNAIEDVRNALYKKAVGFEYEEKKTYVKKDEDGNDVKYTEITRKYSPPDNGAIGMYLKHYDNTYSDKDAFTRRMLEREMALKEKQAEKENW